MYSECLPVALATQHAKRMRLVVLPSVAYLTVPYFSALYLKNTRFLEKQLLYKQSVFDFLYTVCLKDSPFEGESSETLS